MDGDKGNLQRFQVSQPSTFAGNSMNLQYLKIRYFDHLVSQVRLVQ